MTKLSFETACIIVDGTKGGVGKSFTGRLIAHLLAETNQKFLLIDADPKGPIVGLTYAKEIYGCFQAGVKVSSVGDGTPQLESQIVFTDNIQTSMGVDKILAFAKSQNTLLVLPSNTAAAVDAWFTGVDIPGINEDESDKRFFIKVFVISGDLESATYLQESLNIGRGQVPHVVILNEADNSSRLDTFLTSDPVKRLLASDCVSTIRLSSLYVDPADLHKINENRLTFADILTSELVGEGTQRRTKVWLKKTASDFRANSCLGMILAINSTTEEKNRPKLPVRPEAKQG